jgi:hypothetical protein
LSGPPGKGWLTPFCDKFSAFIIVDGGYVASFALALIVSRHHGQGADD